MGVLSKLYDRDFYAWSREQASLLRAGRLAEADVAHIAEEIESMGRSEKRELVNRFVVLLLHLAKWRYQPNLRGRSRELSIKDQRLEIVGLLDDNPSLRPLLAEVLALAWPRASVGAERETGLDAVTFPADCPWTAEQALDQAFLPE